MKFQKIFFDGALCDEESDDMDSVVVFLKNRANFMHSLCVDDIIEFIDSLSLSWANDADIKKRFGSSLNHLLDTMKKEHVTISLDTALRDRMALDRFVKLDKGHLNYHAQPRGLAVHWIAGNVPILGLFSLFQAVSTKNVNLIKASSKAYEDLIFLIAKIGDVNTEKIKGIDIAKSIAVVLVERSDNENQSKMSLSADLRVAWGGKEAIDSILSLKKRFWTEDIVNGPKYSYALISREELSIDIKKIARSLAIDISVFDQYACSSPHTVFVEEGGNIDAKEFASVLANEMALVNRILIPKGKTDPAKVMEILSIRAKYEFTGEVFSSDNTDWTVIYSDEKGLSDACFSRVVFVRPIRDALEVSAFNNRNKQTMGLTMPNERRFKFIDEATVKGVDRCPPPGKMSFHESPWDGSFALDKMVRWVTCYD